MESYTNELENGVAMEFEAVISGVHYFLIHFVYLYSQRITELINILLFLVCKDSICSFRAGFAWAQEINFMLPLRTLHPSVNKA